MTKRNTSRRPRAAPRAPMTADEYLELIQAFVDQARADFVVAEKLAAEARHRFGVDIDLSGEDE